MTRRRRQGCFYEPFRPASTPFLHFCFNALRESAETAERATTPDLHRGNRISDLVKLGSGSVWHRRRRRGAIYGAPFRPSTGL